MISGPVRSPPHRAGQVEPSRSVLEDVEAGLALLPQVLDALPAGVVAIDGDGDVVLGNDFIREFTSADASGPDLVFRHTDGRLYHDGERPILLALRTGSRVAGLELDILDRNGRERFLLASAVPVFGRDGRVRLAVAAYFDITTQKQADLRAADDRKRQEELLDTLRTSLLPPHLPVMRGARLAARYHAATQDIGGDFYDVFPLRGQSFGIVVGDVCGQGPDAAVVTSLVRYTLRGAAMSTRHPSEALELVNETLLDADTERFCTAVFGRVRRERDGLHVQLARAGHPFPFIKRRDGEVRAVDHGGALLGVLDRLRIEEEHVVLAPGDSLVLVTDGVTEAVDSHGAELGWEGVCSMLEELSPEATPDEIADDLRAASTRHGAGDDVAIVVLQAATAS